MGYAICHQRMLSLIPVQLTKVTDNEGKTTQYEYDGQGGGSSMITKITDKVGAVTNLAWYFTDDASGAWGAYKIEVTDAAGLKSVYERSVASSVDTVTPKDGVQPQLEINATSRNPDGGQDKPAHIVSTRYLRIPPCRIMGSPLGRTRFYGRRNRG